MPDDNGSNNEMSGKPLIQAYVQVTEDVGNPGNYILDLSAIPRWPDSAPEMRVRSSISNY